MRRKRPIFWSILLLIPFAAAIVMVEGYYLYGYLRYSGFYCGRFGQLDNEVGWVLRPNTESCIRGEKLDDGSDIFYASVYVDEFGFRTGEDGKGVGTLDRTIMTVGDSHTFGYGVDYEDSFPGILNARPRQSALAVASPAYSGAQALLLARRWIAEVRPQFVDYLERGFLNRSICTGATEPSFILKPCYWVDGDSVQLVAPKGDDVTTLSSFGLTPGGMLGVGEATLTYFLISRPLQTLHEKLVRLGWASGFGDDYDAYATEAEMRLIRQAHFRNLSDLAAVNGATLILLDRVGMYDLSVESGRDMGHIVYVGREEWAEKIDKPAADLPAHERQVPGDTHPGPGTHLLIADLISGIVQNR